jgi:hypothetical protein
MNNRISHHNPVGFAGRTDYLYDVDIEVCTHWVQQVEEYHRDTPRVPQQPWKGFHSGLTVWDVLECCTHDMDEYTSVYSADGTCRRLCSDE